MFRIATVAVLILTAPVWAQRGRCPFMMSAQFNMQRQMQARQQQMMQQQMARQMAMQQRQRQFTLARVRPATPPRTAITRNVQVQQRRTTTTRVTATPIVRLTRTNIATPRQLTVKAPTRPGLVRRPPPQQTIRVTHLRSLAQPRKEVVRKTTTTTQTQRRITRTTTPIHRPATPARREAITRTTRSQTPKVTQRVTQQKKTTEQHRPTVQLRVSLNARCGSCHNCTQRGPGISKMPTRPPLGITPPPNVRQPLLVRNPLEGPQRVIREKAPPPRFIQQPVLPPVGRIVGGRPVPLLVLPPLPPLERITVPRTEKLRKELVSLGTRPRAEKPSSPGITRFAVTAPPLPTVDAGLLRSVTGETQLLLAEMPAVRPLMPWVLARAPEAPPLETSGFGLLPGLKGQSDYLSEVEETPELTLEQVASAPKLPDLPESASR